MPVALRRRDWSRLYQTVTRLCGPEYSLSDRRRRVIRAGHPYAGLAVAPDGQWLAAGFGFGGDGDSIVLL